MNKTLFFILIFFISCSSKTESVKKGINFDQVLLSESLSDTEKLINLQIQLSKQQDQMLNMQKESFSLQNSFDSLKTENDSVIYFLKVQIDSFRTEQSMLIGPEFSNNIIKLYNKVNILEDRAFFMDSLYFELVTDMVIIENQISSMENSIREIDAINKKLNTELKSNESISAENFDYSYDYKVAHQMYMRGDFDASLIKFQNLLEKNIDESLADNCQFWIGQILFSKKNYINAIEEFKKVLIYRDSNKKSESIYKIGLSYIKLDNTAEAKKMFQQIINNYPKSKYFSKASEFILTLR